MIAYMAADDGLQWAEMRWNRWNMANLCSWVQLPVNWV